MACAGVPYGGAACTCGCCEPPGRVTPLELWNRPGLARIDYRVGTYGGFRRAMLEAASRQPDLRPWTARSSDDYAVALVSMWAYIADVLTFYGERAIHEAFLGTAIHDRSLHRLAAMLDYLPSPGAAASAHLAYLAEAGKRFEVRPAMRVQSVPGQDERPRKFEPIETVAVEPGLGEVPVLPQPSGGAALAAGAASAAMAPAFAAAGPELAVGDKLVADVGSAVEEKVLDGVEEIGWRTVIRWKPAFRGASATLFKLRRRIRLFGHNAPDPWMQPIVPSGGGAVTFKEIKPGDTFDRAGVTGLTYSLDVSGDVLHLDGVYDLSAGARVLVAGGSGAAAFARLRRVDAADVAARTIGPLSGSVTRLDLNIALPWSVDLRTVTVYELVETIPGQAEIDLWTWDYGPAIPAGSTAVFLRAATPGAEAVLARVEKGRRLILADGTGAGQAVTALGPPAVRSFGGVEHLEVSFQPPLAAPLESASAVLRGNVAAATDGETVRDEVLGSGDAARTFQRFAIAKPFVTHVPDPTAEHGARSTLEVRVDGVRWHPVRGFYGAGGDERVYIERVDEQGRTSVVFGDGSTGARVTSGKNNVTATYRHGLGLAGRVAAGALRVALDRPPGLKSAANPLPAYGGGDPETGERVRENAPNGVRTFGRIVSLADFEDAARDYSGVAKARAVERWEGEQRGVWLFVAGDGGALLGSAGLAGLRAYLDLRRDRHRRLTVRDHRPVRVVLELDVETDPDHQGVTVQAAVAAALAGHFDFERRGLGEPVRLSDLYRTAQEVEGVVGVDFDRLGFKDPSSLDLAGRGLRFDGAGLAPLQPRLLLYGDELAAIESPAADVTVHLGIPGVGSAG